MEFYHNGYGSLYNKLYILDAKTIKKITNTPDGIKKLKNEIMFYNFVNSIDIDFKCPIMYDFDNKDFTYYTMSYYSDYNPLCDIFPFLPTINKEIIIKEIKTQLDILHNSSEIKVTKEDFKNHVYTELIHKVYNRYETIKNIIKSYDNIKYVNGFQIKPFDVLMNKIKNIIDDYLYILFSSSISDDTILMFPIHGDCNFHNVLINRNNYDICFIDPKAAFGNSLIYGIKEYDDAKILFALSGYDFLDEEINPNIIFNEDNTSVEITLNIMLEHHISDSSLFIKAILASIWLGNAHAFKHNTKKLLYSYFTALYIASKYLP